MIVARPSLEPLEDRLAPAVLTVNTAVDEEVPGDGQVSLREAITMANALLGADRIEFAIDAGLQTIDLLSALPAITDPVTIAGQTQPGFAGTPLIELNGAGAGSSQHALVLKPGAAGAVVRSLIINRFDGNGIRISSGGCRVAGCFIGTNASGSTALGNNLGGVFLGAGSSGNVIGGTRASARNIISGNTNYGVWIEGAGTFSNAVMGNYIGTDVTGTLDLGNVGLGVGILFGASGNLIGGTTPGAANVISGNENGVMIHGLGTTANRVQGNFIGTDAAGAADLGNSLNGVRLRRGANGNVIGGSAAEARNIISGNNRNGVEITSTGTTGNLVRGNWIGIDSTGAVALGNSFSGISLGVFFGGAGGNIIGGTTAGARNVISGNGTSGVELNGTGVTGNLVIGNFIGTDKTGTLALPNVLSGVQVNDTHGNIIGDTLPGSRNVISGNTEYGISLSTGSAGNRVQGNFIGTDKSGKAALGNGLGGVLINTQGTANVIGGTSPGARNVITGNVGHGVDLMCDSARVLGNFIGTDVTGTIGLGNNGSGVSISGGARNNTVGGSAFGAGNVISGNNFNGVHISGATTSQNRVQGNRIGVAASSNAPVGNGADGVFIGADAANNRVGAKAAGAGNVIAFNVGAGVAVFTGTGNSVLGNRIFENAGRGIDLGSDSVTPNDTDDPDTGPNDLLNFPVLTKARLGPAGLRIIGSINTEPGKTLRIEFFACPTTDPTGFGEGKRFLGFITVETTTLDNTPTFSVLLSSFGVQAGHVITATATDALGSTSEFSQALAVT